MSKVVALYHIVFCTKYRQMFINNDHREDLYRYIWSLLKKKGCYLVRISGVPNHIHMLIDLNPIVALSDLMRELKSSTSRWMAMNDKFPMFSGWAKEYYAATLGVKDKDCIIEYIKSQQEHHLGRSFDEEIQDLCLHAGMSLYKDDFSI